LRIGSEDVFWGTRWFFSANTGRFWEPTSGLEPLTPAHYE
jgi:hypothetical protein